MRPNRTSVASVAEVAVELNHFIRKQVAVAKRMQHVQPPPTNDEIRAHTARVAATVRRIADGDGRDEKAFAADVEVNVARPIGDARTLSELQLAVRTASTFCHAKHTASVDEDVPNSSPTSHSACHGDVLRACARLWELDVNRLTPGVDYEIDLQGRSKGYSHDAAPGPLFKFVGTEVWEKPTFKLFYPLLAHYRAQTGIEENVTRIEIDQQRLFISAICATPCMRFAYRWLVDNEKLSSHVRHLSQFQEMLSEMWFGLYRRDGCRDSSAFEHVFAGEVDGGKVKGMHNFLQLHKEESAGNFDYKGYLLPRPTPNRLVTPSACSHLLTIRFDWLEVTKAASSVFFGTSPEFEIALYTMLFIGGERENKVELGPYLANIKIYSFGNKIGSAYPEALALSPNQKLDESTVTLQSAIRTRREEKLLQERKKEDEHLGRKVEKLCAVGGKIGKLFGIL